MPITPASAMHTQPRPHCKRPRNILSQLCVKLWINQDCQVFLSLECPRRAQSQTRPRMRTSAQCNNTPKPYWPFFWLRHGQSRRMRFCENDIFDVWEEFHERCCGEKIVAHDPKNCLSGPREFFFFPHALGIQERPSKFPLSCRSRHVTSGEAAPTDVLARKRCAVGTGLPDGSFIQNSQVTQ
jgi:hypothetical protein